MFLKRVLRYHSTDRESGKEAQIKLECFDGLLLLILIVKMYLYMLLTSLYFVFWEWIDVYKGMEPHFELWFM